MDVGIKAYLCKIYEIMRTTVDIPDQLLRHAKAAAALEGKSLKEFFTEAVVHELERSADKKIVRRKVSLPLVSSDRPGILQLTSDEIARVLSQEDYHVLAGH
jgi:hypothetical protein